ncbi:MAG: hypothetical protein ACQEP9_08560 [Bacillota bacterium]
MRYNNDVTKDDLLEPVKGAQDYLQMVIENKNLIVVPLTNEEYETAWAEIDNLITGINELNSLLHSIKNLLNIDYKKLNYDNNTLEYYIKQLNNFLEEEIISAVENEDYILLTDLINYELESNLKSYKQVFIKLEEHINNLQFDGGDNNA